MRLALALIIIITSNFASGKIMLLDESVRNFELDRYLGTWYEIARMDHSFERGLSNVTAEYALLENGKVSVTNRGFSDKKAKWKTAKGKAKFKANPGVGAFDVTFFWPFYGGYHIVLLAEDYRYALVAGDSEKYLWILSRSSVLDPDDLEAILARAMALGYNTEKLIWVDQSLNLSSLP